MRSFRVVDNEFNRAWNRELIGFRFKVAPSYTCVEESMDMPDYHDFNAWKRIWRS